jgi:twitching motility protein PilT
MISLEELLCLAKERNASDLLIMVGDAPAMRVVGEWIRFDQPKCTAEYLETTARGFIRPEAWQQLVEKRELDFSCTFPKTGRVRCNAHFQRDHLSIVLRLVWPAIPDPEQLGIPPHVIRAGEQPHGLVLVSGPTGSGKSTTLAAIVEHINKNRSAHVITIEDPIEFIYTNAKALIEQREIGADTHTWHSALRTVLRQAPDVIVLGELRDLESITIALGAAETGHLVLASVHASTAAGAVSRMVDVFPPSQASQIRVQLSQSLRMVFAQHLIPGRRPATRVLLYEVLVNTPAIANLIRLGEFEQINNAMSAGRDFGMITFPQCFRDLVARGVITGNEGPVSALPFASPTLQRPFIAPSGKNVAFGANMSVS